MNAGMLSSQFCQMPPSPCRNSSGGPSPPVSTDVDRAGPSTISCARHRRPVDRHPRRVVAVGVPSLGPRAQEPVRARSRDLPVHPVTPLPYPRPVRIAIDIDSTLHPYWDQLDAVAQRRFGVALPVRRRSATWASPALRARAGPAPRRRDPQDEQVLAAVPYPGAVEAMRAWHEAGPLHPHHLASHARRARCSPSAWLRRIGLPYDELYCSFDKVARCLRARDRRADRRLAGQPHKRAADVGYHPRHARASLEPRRCATERTACAPVTGRRCKAERLEPVLR